MGVKFSKRYSSLSPPTPKHFFLNIPGDSPQKLYAEILKFQNYFFTH